MTIHATCPARALLVKNTNNGEKSTCSNFCGIFFVIFISNYEYMLAKKWFIIFLMVMAGLGCKKPVTPIPPNPVNPVVPDEFSVLIDGVKWTATNYTAHCSLSPSTTHAGHDTTIKIDAYDTIHHQMLSFYISGWKGKTGSYNTPGGGNDYLLRFYFDPNTSLITQSKYSTVSGKVIITKITPNNIQGVFDAALEDIRSNKLSFTNGIFSIPYKPL
jgi:hypothetical protein